MAHLFVPSNSSFTLSAKKKFPASLPNRLNVFKLRMISKQKIFKRRSCTANIRYGSLMVTVNTVSDTCYTASDPKSNIFIWISRYGS